MRNNSKNAKVLVTKNTNYLVIMNENQILSDIVDTLTDRPEYITIEFEPSTFIERLRYKFSLFRSQKTYEIRNLKVVNAYRISQELLPIKASILALSEAEMYELLTEHLGKIVKVIALAVYNKRDLPSINFEKEILYTWTNIDLIKALIIVLQKLNIRSFYNTIVLMMSIDILKTSPQTGELIAPEKTTLSK